MCHNGCYLRLFGNRYLQSFQILYEYLFFSSKSLTLLSATLLQALPFKASTLNKGQGHLFEETWSV